MSVPDPAYRLLGVALGLYAACSLFSMATMSIATGVVLLAAILFFRGGLLKAFQEELRRPEARGFFHLSLALALALIVSLAAALVFPQTYGGRPLHIHFLKDLAKLWYLFWPVLLALSLRQLNGAGRERVLRVWLITFFVVSAIGLGQFFTGWPRRQPIPGFDGQFHVTLFLGHHLSVASVFIFPFFAALDLLPGARGRWRGFLAAAVLVGLVALVGTWSRMLWGALPVGLLVWALLKLPRRWGVGLGVAMLLGIFLVVQIPKVSERVRSSMGTQERTELWRVNYQFFKERPLTGTGWRHNEEAAGAVLSAEQGGRSVFTGHAHNNFLDLLGGAGLLGITAWLLWWGYVIRLAWRARSRSGGGMFFGYGLLCAFLVFHLNGLTQVNFWEGKVEHQLSWVIAWLLVFSSKPGAHEEPGH